MPISSSFACCHSCSVGFRSGCAARSFEVIPFTRLNVVLTLIRTASRLRHGLLQQAHHLAFIALHWSQFKELAQAEFILTQGKDTSV
ncbi:MAG: hypothetical protein ACO1NO_06375 [Burkholderiaceae bacterium]